MPTCSGFRIRVGHDHRQKPMPITTTRNDRHEFGIMSAEQVPLLVVAAEDLFRGINLRPLAIIVLTKYVARADATVLCFYFALREEGSGLGRT
jgi:hypothetical protein